jgi:hypothetical protein
LEYVKEQTPELCLEAVRQDGVVLRHVKAQTPEVCLEAVRQNGLALEHVEVQTPEICREAVRQSSYALRDVKEQTREICMLAVAKDFFSLAFVNEDLYKAIPLEMRMAAAERPYALPDGLHAKLVKDDEAAVRERVAANPKASSETLTKLSQDEDAAVRRAVAANPHTPAEALAAMKEGRSVDIAPEKTKLEQLLEVELAGGNAALGHAMYRAEAASGGAVDTLAKFLRWYPEAISFTKPEDRTPEVCMEAVRINGLALNYVNEQTPALCLEAVRQNGGHCSTLRSKRRRCALRP